ncbi:hypothetical protein [Microbacterium sp. XT11]|uniref:hypothetical protein n=1 Tax=Microbacterium sp. XT11 TaxID=367477 RepID=UPI0008301667|nr:hypothetical protein [Microbacterium sp. XT11]
MKLYVFEYVAPVTRNYHDGGGLVIITDRDPLEAWRGSELYVDPRKHYGKADWAEADIDLSSPDAVYDVDADEERVFVFPDSGCC